MGCEGYIGLLLGGDKDQTEAGRKTWGCMGEVVLAGYVSFVNVSNSHQYVVRPGKLVSDHEERIPGGLKHAWKEGMSKPFPKPKIEA